MTTIDRFAAPWHKISFDRFLSDRLPALLAERLPAAGYTVEAVGEHTCRMIVDFGAGITLVYPDLPQPDAEGLFWLDGSPYIVIPTASNEELDKAEIACVGEQLYSYIAARMGTAEDASAYNAGSSADIEWDEATARAFLPLDAWVSAFLRTTAQPLDTTNWNSRTTHIRRLLIPSRTRVVAPGQMGRVDPFETPEGPLIGKVFTIALGATIRDGRLIITDNRPAAALGHNAAQIPFIENDDANRLLMGVNMMRQGLVPEEAEPALVQTGLAPANPGPDFWCGRNLLTAFVAWGEGSVEDGLVISESCARHLGFPYPAEPGDKLANRHGTMGVVSQVFPDAQMPHLPDGTPVEIACSFSGLARRCVAGLVREAVMGRIARVEGKPAIVPPFQAPSAEEIQARLLQNGLPETGMEHLHAGQDGPELPYTSTVGWVYWYRLAHLALPKLYAAGGQSEQPVFDAKSRSYLNYPTWEDRPALGEQELRALLQTGAVEFARESATTRALGWTGSASPYFQDLAARLAAAGIDAALEDGRPGGDAETRRRGDAETHREDGKQVTFRFSPEKAVEPLKLARPARHPWLPEEQIDMVGRPPEPAGTTARAAFDALAQSNERLARWLAAAEPQGLTTRQSDYLISLLSQLDARLAAYLDALLPASAMQFDQPQTYSARAVISPASGLRIDQVGLPAEIIDALFGEEAKRHGAPGAPSVSLDQVIEDAWVVIHRAPTLSPAALIAFHPVRVAGPSIRLHTLTCALLDTDFDGDRVTVFLPLSEAAQREAGEKLSVEGHLRRDPALLPALIPPHEGLWGLAYLSLTPDGRRQIADTLGVDETRIPSPLAKSDLAALLAERLSSDGPAGAIRAAAALAHLGYAACSASGASLSPFPVSQVPLPPAPDRDDPKTWELYSDICAEAILSGRDYRNPNLGPQLLSTAIRPKERRVLRYLLAPGGPTQNADGQTVIGRRSIAEGRSPAGLFASVNGARQSLASLTMKYEEMLQEKPPADGAFTVIARARRAKRPGIVFARAAASGEVDPLTDVETKILLGE